ncbi:hypothetical protein HDU88_008261 [Geranomyces variabilis]|nr:hypothetical protein HDU88_008261 [Geranomyces variabilis]
MTAPYKTKAAAKRPSSKSRDSKPRATAQPETKADTAEWAARRLDEVMMARLGLGGSVTEEEAKPSSKKRKAKAGPPVAAARDTKTKKKKVEAEEEEQEEEQPHSFETEQVDGKPFGYSIFEKWLAVGGAESESDDSDDEAETGSWGEDNGEDYEDEDEDADEVDSDQEDFQSDDEFTGLTGGDSEDEEEEEGTSPQPSSLGPQVIVFQDAVRSTETQSALLASTSQNTKSAYRAFMSSSIKKQTSSAKPPKKLSAREAEQETLDLQHDRDLADLLRTSKLVEQFTTSELTGADRRAHMRDKVVALGGKAAKLKIPRQIQMGMDVKERQRGAQRLQEAKDLGTYHAKFKTQIMGAQGQKDLAAKTDRIKERVKHRSRGIDGGFGSFRNGTLHVGKDEMERVEKMGKKPARGGGGGGGRGRGGGGRGGGRGGRSSGKKPTKIRR